MRCGRLIIAAWKPKKNEETGSLFALPAMCIGIKGTAAAALALARRYARCGVWDCRTLPRRLGGASSGVAAAYIFVTGPIENVADH